METAQSLPELVAASQTDAMNADTATVARLAIDIFSVFEARMQHHFRRGPFSRKLKALLVESGEAELADAVYQYYLGVNVLKHGKGASHRELLKLSDTRFVVNADADNEVGLIDVSDAGFFAGLTETILAAYQFLNAR